jgi:hypothetical protein
MFSRVCYRLTYHDAILILFQLHVVVCPFPFDEQARDTQPTLNEVLEHIAIAGSLVGSLVGLPVEFIVGFLVGFLIGCLVGLLVTSQVLQLAFVAGREKAFVVEDVPGREQRGTVVAPISAIVDLFALGNVPFVVAKIYSFIVRPHSLTREVVEPFIFRQRHTLEMFAVACMREVEAVEPAVLYVLVDLFQSQGMILRTYVADVRAAVYARSDLHFLAVPVFHFNSRAVGETGAVEAEDARLGQDALSVADGILLQAPVSDLTGGDACAVLFACSGQMSDVGRGDEAADRKETLVLGDQVVEVGHDEPPCADGSDVAMMKVSLG